MNGHDKFHKRNKTYFNKKFTEFGKIIHDRKCLNHWKSIFILDKNMQFHNLKPFECKICEKSFRIYKRFMIRFSQAQSKQDKLISCHKPFMNMIFQWHDCSKNLLHSLNVLFALSLWELYHEPFLDSERFFTNLTFTWL